MNFFLGIDGGGTHTRALVVDASGTKAGWAKAGATNPNHVPPANLAQNLRDSIHGACKKLDAFPSDCLSAFWGAAGVTTEAGRKQLRDILLACGLSNAKLGVDHDIRIALAGGLAGKPGIALIIGTGSSCYGRSADGRSWQTGGWEALISDEGSGYFLGREAIALAARMADGRTPESDLRKKVFGWLGISSIADILPRIHERGLSRSEIASFAPEVIALAASGDSAANRILRDGAHLLAEMVEANFRMLPSGGPPQIVVTGGLGTTKSIYRDQVVAEIQKLLPTAEIVEPILSPVAGAVLLAIEQEGKLKADAFLPTLRQFSS